MARFAIYGLLIGVAIPVAYGAFLMHRLSVMMEALPPGAVRCGMPMLGPIAMILLGGPCGAMFGAAIGAVVASVYTSTTKEQE